MKGLLDLIVLALIVTLLINIVCKIVKRCSRSEGMTTNIYTSIPSDFPETQDPAVVSSTFDSNDYPRMTHNPSDGCTVCENDILVNDYIRRNLLAHECKGKDITGEALEKYSNDHFNFRNFTNQTANGGNDMVDRVNDMYLSNNDEYTTTEKGVTIKDLFTNLTQNTDLIKKDCSRGQVMSDNLTQNN